MVNLTTPAVFKLATHPSLIAPLSPHTQCRSDVDLGKTSKHSKEIPTYKLSSRLLWPNRPSGCTFSAHRATRASVWRRCVSETRSFSPVRQRGPLFAYICPMELKVNVKASSSLNPPRCPVCPIVNSNLLQCCRFVVTSTHDASVWELSPCLTLF